MQSIRSRLLIWMVKNRHLFKKRLKPEIIDENFSVEKFREDIDRASERMKVPSDVKVVNEQIGDIHAEFIIPENAAEGKVLLYIHGGGFISGSCHTHRMHVAKFAKGSGIKSLVFDYRLAPEHPFPAPLDDCVKAYEWLLEKGYEAENIIVGGESAGGTLTLSLLLALKERGIKLPKAVFSISPVTDLRCEAESFKYNARNDIAPMNSWIVWTSKYIAGNDIKDPLLSPRFGDLKDFPPLFICVGTSEIHYDDCVNFAKKAEKEDVDVTLSVWPKMVHAFPIFSPLFPEAKKAMEEICGFVKKHAGI